MAGHYVESVRIRVIGVSDRGGGTGSPFLLFFDAFTLTSMLVADLEVRFYTSFFAMFDLNTAIYYKGFEESDACLVLLQFDSIHFELSSRST